MEKIPAIYPQHKSLVDEFEAAGGIIRIGTYANPMEGSAAVFRDKVSAEEFVSRDPFVKEGTVASFRIKEWNESLLP